MQKINDKSKEFISDRNRIMAQMKRLKDDEEGKKKLEKIERVINTRHRQF